MYLESKLLINFIFKVNKKNIISHIVTNTEINVLICT